VLCFWFCLLLVLIPSLLGCSTFFSRHLQPTLSLVSWFFHLPPLPLIVLLVHVASG
jgi:hypothetical protein